MAGRTLAAIGPLGELPTVRIRLVAIHALLKWEWLLKIATTVALQAVDNRVLSQQGILGL